MSTVGERVLARLEEIGKTPARASSEAGLGSTAIRDVITGKSKSPTLATLEALCGPLECSIGYLVGAENVEDHGVTEIGKFWMVCGVGQRSPTYRHSSLKSATEEARRIAEAHSGIIFVVLEALCAVKADKPRITAINVREDLDDDIPF